MHAHVQPNKLAYSIAEAAARASLSRSFLYEEMDRKALPYLKVGARRLISHTDLAAYLDAHRIAA